MPDGRPARVSDSLTLELLAIQARTTLPLRPKLLPSQKVCCISAREADALTVGDLPDCRSHLHISRKEAREWLEAEYGPERLIPTKLFPSGIRQRRYQAQYVRAGKMCYLVIEYASSPQTRMSHGLVCVQWMPGVPAEQPRRGKQISNGYPNRPTSDGTELLLAPHRCQEL